MKLAHPPNFVMKLLPCLTTAGALLGVSVTAAAATSSYHATLLELNNSGVTGNVNLTLDNDANTLQVDLYAMGVDAGFAHAQHIHGKPGMDSQSPTQADDTDGDGFVELAEAKPNYGPVQVPLTSPPGGNKFAGPFPVGGPDNTINFSETYDLSNQATYAKMNMPATDVDKFDKDTLLPLTDREIVVHGDTLDVGDGAPPHEANGTPGYKTRLPVATGEIETGASSHDFSNAQLSDLARLPTSNDVPEPGGLGLLLLGLGLIGGLAATRQTRRRHA